MITVMVRGRGGAVYEMDVPTAGHALDRWQEKIANGDLEILPTDPPELSIVAPDAPRRGRPPKVRDFTESAVEAAPIEGE